MFLDIIDCPDWAINQWPLKVSGHLVAIYNGNHWNANHTLSVGGPKSSVFNERRFTKIIVVAFGLRFQTALMSQTLNQHKFSFCFRMYNNLCPVI